MSSIPDNELSTITIVLSNHRSQTYNDILKAMYTTPNMMEFDVDTIKDVSWYGIQQNIRLGRYHTIKHHNFIYYEKRMSITQIRRVDIDKRLQLNDFLWKWYDNSVIVFSVLCLVMYSATLTAPITAMDLIGYGAIITTSLGIYWLGNYLKFKQFIKKFKLMVDMHKRTVLLLDVADDNTGTVIRGHALQFLKRWTSQLYSTNGN